MPRMGDPPVDVVGDSVSAGMGGEAETWPGVLARRHHVLVHDLSLPGATVESAIREQSGRLSGPGSLVLAEIGGNDVLGETTPGAFERGLDALLARLRQGGRTVVMLELPLPPFSNRYGAAQRRSARRHGVVLIPKRVLLGVLTTGGATLDSVHLSRSGHALMAEAVWRVIRGAFGPRKENLPDPSAVRDGRGVEGGEPALGWTPPARERVAAPASPGPSGSSVPCVEQDGPRRSEALRSRLGSAGAILGRPGQP